MQSTKDKIIEGLNGNQQEAVVSVTGETLVIAGAGSGKTAVLTRRVAYLIACGIQPSHILCLTFTNKAAKEMNQRVRALLHAVDIHLPNPPVWSEEYIQTNPLLCTFHSLGVRILREFGHYIDIQKNFTILDTDDQEKVIKTLLKNANLDPKNYPPKGILSFISHCKQELLSPAHSHRTDREYPDAVHNLYKDYQEHLLKNQTVDFDDLIYLVYHLLHEHQEVRATLHDRWKHILVDEFQDTNQAQFEIIKLLYDTDSSAY